MSIATLCKTRGQPGGTALAQEEAVNWTPKFILSFDEVGTFDYNRVGNKGGTLARLRQAGFPVPLGVIIAADAYRAFVATNHLDRFLTKLLIDEDSTTRSMDDVETAFERAEMPFAVTAAILDAYLALDEGAVAVRSSALAEDDEASSFAGQHDTYLDIEGGDALLVAVRRCWASLWSRRALAYRRRLGSDASDAAMAVVVQKMVPAAQAGVAFTVDPTNGRRDVVVVEAAAGTGEALVSGQATPHRYTFQRGDSHPEIADELLDSARLASVVTLAQEVESWAGQPQDVEWALDHAGRVYLLQARPITTTAGDQLFEGIVRWTRENVGEVVPDPITPLSWSVLDPLVNHSSGGMLRRLGVGNIPDTRLFDRFYGRVYLNQSLFQILMSRFYPSHTSWLAAPRLAWTGLKTLWALHRLPVEGDTISRTILEQYHSEEELDLAGMAQSAVLAQLADWRRLGAAVMEIHLTVTVLTELLYQALDRLLAKWGDGMTTACAASVTTGLTGMPSAEAGWVLATLSQHVRQDETLRALVLTTSPERLMDRLAETEGGQELWAEIQSFLAVYGHAAVQEFELAAPRWRDNPTIILASLRAQVSAAAEKPASDPAAARRATVALVEGQLGPVQRRLFRHLLRWAQVFTVAREDLKYHFVIAHGRLRDLYLALAVRLVGAGQLADTNDIFCLTADEVAALAEGRLSPDEAQDRVVEYRQAWEADRQALPPATFDQLDGHLHRVVSLSAPVSGDGQALHGVGASPGTYVGRARILRTPVDGTGLKPGEILVAPATSSGWAPLLLSAGALVTEIGGLLSHGAIIAREYGLPAVLNVTGATHRIRTGQLICVDGSLGIVQLLSG